MAVYVRGFVIPDVAQVHAAYQKLINDLDALVVEGRRLNSKDTGIFARQLADVRIAYRDFNLGLRKVAIDGSVRATKGMIERLDSNRARPSSGSTPALRDVVEANPLPSIGDYETGAVGVGNVEILNRAVNPHSRGYGTFWRAIEYGTGQGGVPSQVGRILYGSFTAAGGGDATPPMPQYAGGGGPHPVFISGYRPSSGGDRTSGLGTIGKEIEPRHFIRYGADAAAVQWRAEISALQDRAIENLHNIRLGRS